MIIKQVIKVILPKISYNRKIYIENNYVTPITFDSVMKEEADGILNRIYPIEFEKKPIKDLETYIKVLFEEVGEDDKVQIRILNHKKLIKKKPPPSSKRKQSSAHKQQGLTEDILDDVEGSFGGDKPSGPKKKGLIDSIINSFLDKPKKTQDEFNYDSILIHVHGGGFISMSSRSHQTYTRK
jgi:hypothetical protein